MILTGVKTALDDEKASSSSNSVFSLVMSCTALLLQSLEESIEASGECENEVLIIEFSKEILYIYKNIEFAFSREILRGFFSKMNSEKHE